MSIPYNEQVIVIDACCFADDHGAGPHEYARKFLKEAGIEYTDNHECFVDWFVSTSSGTD